MLPSLSVHRENAVAQPKAFCQYGLFVGKVASVTNSQRLEATSSKRAELKVIELRGKERLDIFGIASHEEPVSEDMQLVG